MKLRFLSIIVILLFSGLALGYDFYGTNFQYRKDITIDSSLIDATLNYFPVLVKLTSSNIDFNHFLHGTNDGYDIRFTDSIDGSGDADGAILDYERERFDKTGEVAEIWVEIPSIPTSPDTTFYMFYGNTNCPNGEDVDGTWDGGPDASPANNYKGVWHLSESSGDAQDSTSYGSSGSVSATGVTREPSGKIDGAYDFDHTSDGEVQVTDPVDGHLDFGTGSFTVSLWLNIDDSTTTWQSTLYKGASGTWDAGYSLETNEGATTLYFQICEGTARGSDKAISDEAGITSFDTWMYFVGVCDRSTQLIHIYKDGSEEGTPNSTSAVGSVDNGFDLQFPWGGEYDLNGLLDEVRISNIARSPAWIKASYHSGNDSLLTIPTLVELSYFRATGLDSAVLLEWATETELDNAGFNLWRSEERGGEYVRINPYFIPAEGEAGFGAEYSFTDYDVINGKIYHYKLEDIDIYGKSTLHGPVPAIPNDIIIIWPPDRIIRPSDALVFSWSSSGSYVFKVEISTNLSFLASHTLFFPEDGWISGNSLWLTPREWGIVLRMARQLGGQLFWRVRARSEDGRVIFSDWRKFVIEKHKLPRE